MSSLYWNQVIQFSLTYHKEATDKRGRGGCSKYSYNDHSTLWHLALFNAFPAYTLCLQRINFKPCL